MSYYGWRPWIESALVLGVSNLHSMNVLVPGFEQTGSLFWRDGYGGEIYKVRYRSELHKTWGCLELTDTASTYSISLVASHLHFGGLRWWLVCPLTQRRALKLYRYEAIGKFCHRTAIRPLPTYASQRVSGMERLQFRRWALRRKLNDPCTLWDSLNKPKWMRWRTFERYRQLDESLAIQEDAAFLSRIGRLRIFS